MKTIARVLAATALAVGALSMTACSNEPPSNEECMALMLEEAAKLHANPAGDGSDPAAWLRESGCDERMRLNIEEQQRQQVETDRAAIEACQAQTGMTEAECVADAAAGNAS